MRLHAGIRTQHNHHRARIRVLHIVRQGRGLVHARPRHLVLGHDGIGQLASGFYFAELAANYRRVVATLDFMFGASLYAGYQFYLGENAFIEPSVRASMTFYDIGKVRTSYGDSDWMGDSYIGFNGQAKLAIGYNF